MKTIATFMRNSNRLLLGLWVLQLARFTEATCAATNEYFAIPVVDADAELRIASCSTPQADC